MEGNKRPEHNLIQRGGEGMRKKTVTNKLNDYIKSSLKLEKKKIMKHDQAQFMNLNIIFTNGENLLLRNYIS
jgi:hypothetical protein